MDSGVLDDVNLNGERGLRWC